MKVKTQLIGFLCFVFFGLGSVAAQPSLFFNVENERTVIHPTLGNSYAFDVSMYASYSGTYHSRGLLYIEYDTTKFGGSIDLNNNIALEHAELMQGTVNFLGQIRPKYATVNIIDNRDSIVAITWESDWLSFLPNPLLHNEVADTLKNLYTFYFKIVNTPSAGDVSIFLPLMPNQQYLITDVDGDGVPDEVPYGTINILPVELMDFQADLQPDNSVALSWATFTETNHDFFVLEKQHENGTFFPLGNIEGNGNTQEVQTYGWTDRTEHSPLNYYRLRMVDINGNSSFSDVIQVEVEKQNSIGMFPSPTKGQLYLQSVVPGKHSIFISDITGKLLFQTTIKFTTSNESQSIDLAPYADGVYFIQMIDQEGKSQSRKIIKSQS